MTHDAVRVEMFRGAAMRPHMTALGRLRAEVFQGWPYLYENERGYEEQYAQAYVPSAGAALVLAFAGEAAVGAATCSPLPDETANVQSPFVELGLDPGRFCYFGESVVLPAWRGRGLGAAFFEHREAHALAAGDADFACFCAVERPADHPARPAQEITLDGFWHKRGYVRRPDLACRMAWRDIGAPTRTTKLMVFWLRSLRGAALP